MEATRKLESYHGNWHAGRADQEHIIIRKFRDCQIAAVPGARPELFIGLRLIQFITILLSGGGQKQIVE